VEVYREAIKLSDIFGANLVPIPTRTVKIGGGLGLYMVGQLMVAPAGGEVFVPMTVANRDEEQVGVLGEYVVRRVGVPPTDDLIGTLYFGGSFQADMLVVTDEAPNPSVDVRERREYLLAHNIYLEGLIRHQLVSKFYA
jgi:hypothetical protein